MATFLLIDGGLIFRSFFALPPMYAPDGRPVGGVFGFMAMLFREMAALRPTHVAVAMDVPIETNRRTQLYPDYKGHRPPCPEELVPQFDLLREVLTACNIPWFQAPGCEADDILGTLALQAEQAGMEASLLTGDRDVLQLLSGRTQVRFVRKLNCPETYDVPRFVQEVGLLPGQLPDLKGLAGDPSDNIPGIRGVGPKTAVRLLQEYDTLEAVLENAHRQKGKLRERLEAGREIALLSKQLATIYREVPGLPALSACRLDLNRDGGRAIFQELRLGSLLSQVAD